MNDAIFSIKAYPLRPSKSAITLVFKTLQKISNVVISNNMLENTGLKETSSFS